MKVFVALTLLALVAVATSTVLVNGGLGYYGAGLTYPYANIASSRLSYLPSYTYGSYASSYGYPASYASYPSYRYGYGVGSVPLVYDWLKK